MRNFNCHIDDEENRVHIYRLVAYQARNSTDIDSSTLLSNLFNVCYLLLHDGYITNWWMWTWWKNKWFYLTLLPAKTIPRHARARIYPRSVKDPDSSGRFTSTAVPRRMSRMDGTAKAPTASHAIHSKADHFARVCFKTVSAAGKKYFIFKSSCMNNVYFYLTTCRIEYWIPKKSLRRL